MSFRIRLIKMPRSGLLQAGSGTGSWKLEAGSCRGRPSYCTVPADGHVTGPPGVRHPGCRRAVVVAIFLLLAQDNFTLKLRSAAAAGDRRAPNLHRGARRRRRDTRQRLRRADQRRSGVPRDARRDQRREAADQLRDLHLRHRRDRQSIHRGAGGGRAPRRARQHPRRCGRVQLHGRRARGAPDERGLPDRAVSARSAGTTSRK